MTGLVITEAERDDRIGTSVGVGARNGMAPGSHVECGTGAPDRSGRASPWRRFTGTRHLLAQLLSVAIVAGACGGGDGAAGAATSTAPLAPPSAPPTTWEPLTSADAPAAPDVPPLLVADGEGIRVVDDGRVTTTFLAGTAVDVAVPDRSGGVVYQTAETDDGEWMWVWDEAAARVRLRVREGSGPRPIERIVAPGAQPEQIVSAEDARPTLVQVAVLDGHPTLVYRVWRPITGAICPPGDSECVWVSVDERLVLVELDTGSERALGVIGSFESDYLDIRFSDATISVKTVPYPGDTACGSVWPRAALDPPDSADRWVGFGSELWTRCDFGPTVGCAPPAMCLGSVLATVAPDGTTVAVVETSRSPGVPPQLVVRDAASLAELSRVVIGEPGIGPSSLDWDGTVAVVGREDWGQSGLVDDVGIPPVVVLADGSTYELPYSGSVVLWSDE